MTFRYAGFTSSRTGSDLKSRKIFAVANSPKVPFALRVITSGTSFLTSRVRKRRLRVGRVVDDDTDARVGLLELLRQVLEVGLRLRLELEERDDGAVAVPA